MKKFEVDITFDERTENIGMVLEEIAAKMPNVWVRVIKVVGPGGGWPMMEVMMPEEAVAEFAEWYGWEVEDLVEVCELK